MKILNSRCLIVIDLVANQSICVAADSIVGNWNCGPYTIEGRGIRVTGSDKIRYELDGRYYALSESTTEIVEKSIMIGSKWSSAGKWALEDGILTTSDSEVRFISSDNPKITKERGQQILETENNKKNVSKARVAFGRNVFVRRPIDPLYEEADIEVTCTRTDSAVTEIGL